MLFHFLDLLRTFFLQKEYEDYGEAISFCMQNNCLE